MGVNSRTNFARARARLVHVLLGKKIVRRLTRKRQSADNIVRRLTRIASVGGQFSCERTHNYDHKAPSKKDTQPFVGQRHERH